jgi:chemotaxis family two-component system sensor kinase Cph1
MGATPSPPAIESALATLYPMAGRDQVAVDNLGVRYPELTDSIGVASGALLLPLATGEDDMIVWFRPEVTRTIVWGGNPGEHTSTYPATAAVSPRTSFAAWKETVKGCSSHWTAADIKLSMELALRPNNESTEPAAAPSGEIFAMLSPSGQVEKRDCLSVNRRK